MGAVGATPLAARVRIVDRRADGVEAAYTVEAGEPVLAGHFPGFPIFPGVCLVECAHQASLAALPDGAVLAGIPSARFLAPVFAGDEVRIAARVSTDAGGWDCSVALSVPRPTDGDAGAGSADVAAVQLRYRTRDGADGHR